MLKFSPANRKLIKLSKKIDKNVFSFSIRSGYTCPGASICLAKAVYKEGEKAHIEDGPNQSIRCYSASEEVLYPAVYNQRLHNEQLIQACKTKEEIAELILKSIPTKAEVIRIHVGGDFFSQMYFDAWLDVCKSRPDIIFYAYTKSLHFWLKRKDDIPKNLKLTASKGGRYDKLIPDIKAKTASITLKKGKSNDTDDTSALLGTKNFTLLVHGQQKKGSLASKTLYKLRKKYGALYK